MNRSKRKKPASAKGSPANSVVGGAVIWWLLGAFLQWLNCPGMELGAIIYYAPHGMFLQFVPC